MKKFDKKFKKVVISGYYGFDNFGDETILSVLVKKVKDFTPFITVLSKNPSKTRNLHKVESVLYCCPCLALLKILKADILISGGGSLLQDVTSLKSLIYYLCVINIALFYNRKVIIFAQGIGPINNKFGRWLTQKTLKKCTLVQVRDEKSLFLMRGWGIKADLVCDPLFDLEMFDYEPSGKVGVQLRGFKTLNDKLLQKLAQQINKEFSDKQIEIYSFQDGLDYEVCRRFEVMLRAVNPIIQTKIIYNQTSEQILFNMSKLDYLIAMRFHANLIALKYGIKTLAVCYDEKVEKLANEAQIPYVSMLANEDYDDKFSQLKNLDRQQLLEFANSKHFDWAKIEQIVNSK